MLDELAHAGPEHLDPEYVAAYDRKSGFDPADDITLLREYGLRPEATFVDLGAGTGRVALAAAVECRRVVAVDISPEMCAALRDRAKDAGIRNVDVVEAGYLTYEHDGEPADVVYTRNALHQLPDFWKAIALDRIARMLRPDGTLLVRDLVYDFRPSDAASVFEHWFDAATTDPTVGYTRAEFAEHIRTEHSTYRWLFEPMLIATGFSIVATEFRGATYARYLCRRDRPEGERP
jgi:ubiquinone/menaquinone biosynthesis C-methylase UbiE